jgi:hypothetical protein
MKSLVRTSLFLLFLFVINPAHAATYTGMVIAIT